LKSEISELEKELEKLKLKIQGTLKIGGSQEKKKIITSNYQRVSRLYAKEERAKALKKRREELKEMLE